jgi:predicted transcriptional regulator
MEDKQNKITYPYSPITERRMKRFYNSLNEKDKRHYAAIEAIKLDYGGITYIAELLNCARSTIHDAIEELKKNDFLPPDQIRREGGGRKSLIQTKENIKAVFLQAIEGHVAGDPMNEKIRWLRLTRAEISEKMEALGIHVSRNIVRKLMQKHGFVKRKMQRKRSIGKSANREEQFNNIARAKEKFMSSNNPVISIDTKKKEDIGGNLHRDGSVYCTQALEASDHDYSYLADIKIAPHGIYDMKQNKAYINLGVSAETAEFICDSLKRWWRNHGKKAYPKANEILIFCDAGGANSYRHHIFKSELQNLVNAINMKVNIVHYPPYTSKWNPIEHRVFPHVTRAMAGTPLNTIDDAKNKIKSAKTKTGLTVAVDVIQKTYAKGKKAAKNYMKNLKIKFADSLPKLNYTISPNSATGVK